MIKKALGIDTKKPEPVPAPAPPPKPPNAIDYLRAWNLFKKIPFEKLGSVALLTAIIVFLAISGLLAWISLALRFVFSVAH
jgi:hypothetical protein